MRKSHSGISLPPDWLTRLLFGGSFILISLIFTVMGVFPLQAANPTAQTSAFYASMFIGVFFFGAGVGNFVDGLVRTRVRWGFRMPKPVTVNADKTVPVESQAKLAGTLLQDLSYLYVMVFRIIGIVLVIATSVIFAFIWVAKSSAAYAAVAHPTTILLGYLLAAIVFALLIAVLMLVGRDRRQ